MPPLNRFSRALFTLTLLTGLLVGLVGPSLIPVKAAPQKLGSTSLVISEFRTTGPGGGNDEFIEIFNPTSSDISLSGLKLQKSSGCGTTVNNLYIFGAVSLVPGQHFLIAGPGYSGSATPDYLSLTSFSIADDGGIAITDASTTPIPIDQVGMCAGTFYKEGTTLTPLSGTANQSYERKDNGCTDTDNNSTDFFWNQTSSNPQNSSSIPIPCLRVTHVDAAVANGTYTTGALIPVTVTFSSNVDVTGAPTLLLETGTMPEGKATYVSGSGSNTLTFNYTVQANDVSADLDYVDTNSLALNGGTITGAVGDANLTLPSPGATGSLGASKNIVIDNGIAPSLVSIKRQTPSTTPTNADTLVFRATFSKPVKGVGASNFTIHNNTTPPTTDATVANVSPNTSSNASYSTYYDVTVSGGILTLLSTFNGDVGLDLANISSITDVAGKTLASGVPTGANDVYTVDNIPPTVTIDQAALQADPASAPPVNFTVVFSEAIDVSTFTVGDITQNGTVAASLITWSIADSGNHKTFTLSATSVAENGTLIPSIAAGKVKDLAGNYNNSVSTYVTDGSVTFTDNVPPTVTVNQAVGQADPTNVLPIKFAVVFSEPIIPSIFTPSDITQQTGTGMATGITWVIADSGDHTNFTLSATAVTGAGIISPSIAANRVTDLVGNNNLASISTDNQVVYDNVGPTVTVNRASTQPNPATTLPIRFTVVFSEPINVNTFTSADITQSGTAIVNIWAPPADSGNHMSFTISATSLSRNGTIIPSIAAGKVTDVAGNNNNASTSTDNIVTANVTLSTPAPTLTPTATLTPMQKVIINEIAWMGTPSSRTDQWIELYNPDLNNPVPITNWHIKSTNNNAVNITLTGTIPAGGYFLVANPGTFETLPVNQTATFTLGYTLTSGKSLQLIDDAGLVIDTTPTDEKGNWPAGVACSNTTTSTPIPTPIANTCASMERDSSRGFTKYDWITFAQPSILSPVLDRYGLVIRGTPGSSNWAITVTATPTKTPTVTPRAHTPTAVGALPLVATLVINEFLPRADFDWNGDGKVDVFDEFIEIANLGPIDANLSGWKLDDMPNGGSNPYTLPSRVLKPGEHAVFYASQTNVLLSDGGDTVRLLNPNNVIKDAHTYGLVKVADQSTCRLPDINGSWYSDCFPTPNERNSRTGSVPSAPPGTGLETPLCLLPDTLPEDFQLAECFGFGADMWNPAYWNGADWLRDRSVLQNGSKWDTFVE
jgi:hypothetical protein